MRSVVLCVAFFVSCGLVPAQAGSELTVELQALTLPGLSGACYGFRVSNGLGEVVAATSEVCSEGGGADASWIGLCDASENPNTATLEINRLFDSAGDELPAAGYVNPCPPGAGCQQTFTCSENADVRIDFRPRVLRPLGAGFVDDAVDLGEVQCAAFAACALDSGLPLLLPQPGFPDGVESLLIEIECATTEADGSGGPWPFLYFDAAQITCGPNVAEFDLSSVQATWPTGSALLAHFATVSLSTEAGAQVVSSWRVAFALDRDAASGCQLSTRATAAGGGFAADALAPGVAWPSVDFVIPLADRGASSACDRYELGDASGVVAGGLLVGPHEFSGVFDGINVRPPAP